MSTTCVDERFSACILTSEFSVLAADLHPGQSFPQFEQQPLLASGFPSLFPDTKFPLSPALQLNHDLTDMTQEALEHFARAEEVRFSRASFKTYVVDPCLHVCVISDNSEQLETFLDTYGGVLEIDPLLVKDVHVDHPQIAEIEVGTEENGYKISVTQRSPVDMSLCNYCGACGQVCPESCISPQLRIDFSACSFCRKCESECSVNAIDVYGVEYKTIRVPSIIVLGNTKLELPEKRDTIFTEESLPQYFATLFSTEIEEIVTCNTSLCHYSTKMQGGCKICSSVCQYGAIDLTRNGVVVNYQLCNECGQCVSNCPTGAMQFERFNDSAFAAFFNLFKLQAGATVVIGNEQQFHQLWWSQKGREKFENVVFVEYAEPDALSPFHCLHLLGQGAGSILLLSESRDCKLVSQTNALVDAFFNRNDFVQSLEVKDIVGRLTAIEDRKSLLQQPLTDIPFRNRRNNLSMLLKKFYESSRNDVQLTRADHGPFALITCEDEKCTQCFACLNECKIQALKAGAGAMSLTYNSSLCIGCGACVMVCPENALIVQGGNRISEQFFEDTEVSKTEPMLCKGCGKEFGTKKSFERVMAILNSRNMADKGHFEYCETCRVVKMFEAA